MNKKHFFLYFTIIAIPFFFIGFYLVFVIQLNPKWAKDLGTFGDSFGIVNAFFTGLTFAGLVINLLQQREEIKIQREDLLESRRQFMRGAAAQEKTARINAFSELLKEYNEKISVLQKEVSVDDSINTKTTSDVIREGLYPAYNPKKDNLKKLQSKKNKILLELEDIMQTETN